ncbi:hypothetical protein [Marinobacter sp. LN3S78]|uniref:hypothetical protein n=1 Tax=Marinobacter sp. LN3S78 TaxID=3382300 RepID=UPI00387A9782
MKSWIATSLLLLFAADDSPREQATFEFEPPVQEQAPAERPPPCAFHNLELPESMAVYAAGGYTGRELPFQIDQSGHQATRFDVAVNSPGQPVALMLGAYEPTVWNLGWSQGTEIVAVVVSGYHRQAIAGLEPDVPVLNSSYDNQGSCGYFYVGKDRNAALNPLSRKLFNQPVDLVFPGDRDTGRILVGEPLDAGAELITSTAQTPESFRDPDAPLAGQAGIDQALTRGVLREATPADADAWVDALIASRPEPDIPPVAGEGIPRPPTPRMHRAYVVLEAFTYPSGLYGANSATFFVPEGVPRPEGNPGHSAVHDFNTLTCDGALCR